MRSARAACCGSARGDWHHFARAVTLGSMTTLGRDCDGGGATLARTGIVVVNYGSSALLIQNLTPVSTHTPEATCFVVDNFTSIDEQAQVVRICAERGWTPILLSENSGFGEGVNAGARVAEDAGVSLLVVLNPDATIDRESLRRLVSAVDEDLNLMVSPVVRWPDGRTWFNGSDLYLSDGRMGNPRRRADRPDDRYLEWLTGACFALSMDLWRRVGGFDNDYFLYWEDVELSYRAVEAGGRLLVDQAAVAVHDEGGTHPGRKPGRAKTELYYYYNIRNRLVFAAKNIDDPALDKWLSETLRVSYEILLQGGRRQFLRPVAPLRALVRGIRDGRRFVSERRARSPVVDPPT